MSNSNEKKGKKIPYFYQRLMHVFDSNNIKTKDEITNKQFASITNRKVRLSNEDAKQLLKEMEQMKLVRRTNYGKVKFL